MKIVRPSPVGIGLLGVFMLAHDAALAQTSFQRLGALPGFPFPQSYPSDVSADGRTVVGVAPSLEPGGWRAFRWRADLGMQDLGVAPAGANGQSSAVSVSADGSVITGRMYNNATSRNQPFVWTEEAGMFLIGAYWEGAALSVSADGSTVVGYGYAENFETGGPFRWTESSGARPLTNQDGTPLSVGYYNAVSVSHDGAVVTGERSSATGGEAYRWTQETGPVGLGNAGWADTVSIPTAISDDGTTIVGRVQGTINGEFEQQAFRWTEQTGMVLLGYPPGFTRTAALDVSADGGVVVGQSWVWTEQTGFRSMYDIFAELGLDTGQWHSLGGITGVSADGRTLVGYGTNTQGLSEGWVAVIPAPGSLIVAPMLAFAAARRR